MERQPKSPHIQVLLKGEARPDGKHHWTELGRAFRHKNGGGWNLLLDGLRPEDETLVIMDAQGYAPDTKFGVYITQEVNGETEWFRVGTAKVSAKGKGVLVFLSSVLKGSLKLVLLPKRGGKK